MSPSRASAGARSATDQRDHGVEILEGDLQALEDVEPLLGLAEIEDRPARDHLAAVIEEDAYRVAQTQQLAAVPRRWRGD